MDNLEATQQTGQWPTQQTVQPPAGWTYTGTPPTTEAPEPEPAESPIAPVPVEEPPAATPEAPPAGPLPDHEEPRVGQFVDVIAGEHAGVFGVYLQDDQSGPDGKPTHVLVRNRDHGKAVDMIVVPYDDVRPSARTGGR